MVCFPRVIYQLLSRVKIVQERVVFRKTVSHLQSHLYSEDDYCSGSHNVSHHDNHTRQTTKIFDLIINLLFFLTDEYDEETVLFEKECDEFMNDFVLKIFATE